uniref:Uncharacterized protein n=1 Tax=Romanomermis culicivorax TaxID=13658 RepID=A0A915KSW1_ROMCU
MIVSQLGARGFILHPASGIRRRTTSPSIDDQFVHCQMHGKSLKCGDIFGGHLTDIGLCATFNMIHSEAIRMQANSLGLKGLTFSR